MMQRLVSVFLIPLFVIGSLLALLGLFTVDERERGLVTFLGRFEKDASGQPKVLQSGLHFAWPVLNRVYLLSAQLQTLDVSQSPMVTQDQKNVVVDYYVKWQIIDSGFPQFFTATGGGSMTRAQDLVARITGDEVRAALGSYTLSDVLKDERSNMMQHIRTLANQKSRSLGIQLKDVRIKRIDLPKEVTETVFRQIRSQREQAATVYRSQGRLAGERIRAEADRQVVVTLAQAEKTSRQLRGEGDAQAVLIRKEAYTRDPDFYQFYQRMQAYASTFASEPGRLMVLKPEGDFFANFRHMGGNVSKKNDQTQ